MTDIKIKLIHPLAQMPRKGTPGSNAYDLYAVEPAIVGSEPAIVSTGLTMQLPENWAAFIIPRSGMAAKFAITVINAPGLIDSDYRGEVKVILTKLGPDVVYPAGLHDHDVSNKYKIVPGDKIAQILFLPTPAVNLIQTSEELETTQRTGGLGSTGK